MSRNIFILFTCIILAIADDTVNELEVNTSTDETITTTAFDIIGKTIVTLQDYPITQTYIETTTPLVNKNVRKTSLKSVNRAEIKRAAPGNISVASTTTTTTTTEKPGIETIEKVTAATATMNSSALHVTVNKIDIVLLILIFMGMVLINF